MTKSFPNYDSLPETDGGARSGWGLFGAEDNLGLMNLQTPQRIASAAKLVRTGNVFPLDISINFFGPPAKPGARGAPERVLNVFGAYLDDYLNGFFLQGASQWDALGHVPFKPGVFYNGVTTQQVESGDRNTIDHWAKRGVVGRAIVLDIPRALHISGRKFDPLDTYAITVDDLEQARKVAKVEYEPGDVILLRTGHLEALAQLDLDARRRVCMQPLFERGMPGLAHTEEMARYVWNTHASAIGADNMAVEVWPCTMDLDGPMPGPGWPFGYMHNVYIGLFGLALGEYFWLADLAADCADDGVYEAFFASAPLNVPGGVGSPPNALVIK